MNTNNTMQPDMLDILFANRNKTYGAYQLRKNYNKRLSVSIAVMLSICALFVVSYGLGKKQYMADPIIPTVVVELENLHVKEKPVVPPPTVKPIPIERHIETIHFATPVLVEEVTTPPPTMEDMENVRIDVKSTPGDKGELVMPPIEAGTGAVQSLVKKEEFETVFTKVQKEAQFPGGLAAWMKFLQRNLRSDVPTDNGAVAGSYTVVVSFLVDKDGNISEVKAENDPGYGTAAEAVRVIQRGPTWIPALQNGRNVIYRQRQSITFLVEQQ